MVTALAPAKINLVLEVLSRRRDGYHEILSLMQTVDLCDELIFEPADEISLECIESSLQGTNNLVLKAALLLKETTGFTKGVKIKLKKHIPWGVGLGGGSSDAAVTLMTLNQLWGLNLQMSELTQLAAQLGSDVPFFLYQDLALVSGRGEKVRPLLRLIPLWFVILIPPLPLLSQKTGQLYKSLTPKHFTAGEYVKKAVRSLSEGRRFDSSLLFNIFEWVAYDVFPRLSEYKERLIKAGVANICLTGSGPALYSIVEEETAGRELCNRLYSDDLECYLVSTFIPGANCGRKT